jgi:hypothetical protein
MNEEKRDPFMESLGKWKMRVEQIAFFLFLVLHLLLIELIGISLLVQHLQKLTSDLQTAPEVEKPKENRAR